jgi:hypothetical protein
MDRQSHNTVSVERGIAANKLRTITPDDKDGIRIVIFETATK